MSNHEEKVTDSVASQPEGEQQAAAAASQSEAAESDEKSASPDQAAEASPNPEVEVEVEVATDTSAEGEVAAEEASDDGGEVLEIEVEAEEEEAVADLAAKVEELEEGKKANYDRFLRASADLENLRKRSRRDVKDARLDERGKILRDMLPVIDNLDRAVAHAEQTDAEATKSIVEGVNLVLRQFRQALERHAVTPFESVGNAFDPALHEAVSQSPSADHPPGTIISALQTGYMMDERLLRPALVVVAVAMPAKEPPSEEEAQEEEPAEKPEVIEIDSTEELASAAAKDDDSASVSETEAATEEADTTADQQDSTQEDEAEESNTAASEAKD